MNCTNKRENFIPTLSQRKPCYNIATLKNGASAKKCLQQLNEFDKCYICINLYQLERQATQ